MAKRTSLAEFTGTTTVEVSGQERTIVLPGSMAEVRLVKIDSCDPIKVKRSGYGPGSFGYQGVGKVTIVEDGRPQEYQANIILTVVGSSAAAEAPEIAEIVKVSREAKAEARKAKASA